MFDPMNLLFQAERFLCTYLALICVHNLIITGLGSVRHRQIISSGGLRYDFKVIVVSFFIGGNFGDHVHAARGLMGVSIVYTIIIHWNSLEVKGVLIARCADAMCADATCVYI